VGGMRLGPVASAIAAAYYPRIRPRCQALAGWSVADRLGAGIVDLRRLRAEWLDGRRCRALSTLPVPARNYQPRRLALLSTADLHEAAAKLDAAVAPVTSGKEKRPAKIKKSARR
jgi:hypothetical protein